MNDFLTRPNERGHSMQTAGESPASTGVKMTAGVLTSSKPDRFTPDPFRDILSHTKSMMIEQIMALIGRASSDPKRYRRTLESFAIATLRRTLEELTENFGTNGDKTEEPLGRGVNQSTIAASGEAGEIAVCASQGSPSSPALLTLQSTLP